MLTTRGGPVIGVSLKMYFGYRDAIDWLHAVAALARTDAAIRSGAVDLFVTPSFVALPAAADAFARTRVRYGGQDVAVEDRGPFTGEVSAVELAELGCTVVEVGHAERRTLFGETDAIVAAKTAAALRNGLTPVICIGESAPRMRAAVIAECLAQLDSALTAAPAGNVIVAYEPVWAIGAAAPADPDHIRDVCSALRTAVSTRAGSAVLYGGSAGPGLLTELGQDVDGLFLGRFAHDVTALQTVLAEAARVVA